MLVPQMYPRATDSSSGPCTHRQRRGAAAAAAWPRPPRELGRTPEGQGGPALPCASFMCRNEIRLGGSNALTCVDLLNVSSELVLVRRVDPYSDIVPLADACTSTWAPEQAACCIVADSQWVFERKHTHASDLPERDALSVKRRVHLEAVGARLPPQELATACWFQAQAHAHCPSRAHCPARRRVRRRWLGSLLRLRTPAQLLRLQKRSPRSKGGQRADGSPTHEPNWPTDAANGCLGEARRV